MRTSCRIMIILLVLTVLAGCSSASQTTDYAYSTSNPNSLYYSNPIVLERADPWIYEHSDGYYYMIASVPEYDRLEVRRALTVTSLAYADPIVVWEKNETGIMSKNIWAPEMYNIDGKWYIYFSAAREGSDFDHRMYVLENSSDNPLEGEWELKGQIRTGHEVFQIDASLFEHQGTWYIMWSGAGAKGNSLYMAPLENPWTIAESRIMLTEPEYDWEIINGARVTEGPQVIKHRDRIFITYSASFCDANYNMGALSANVNSDLMDPASWEKTHEPIFVSNADANAYGPGHGSFVESPDSTELIHVYHGVDGVGKGFGCDKARNIRIQPYQYDDQGQPDLGDPVSRGYTIPSPSGEARFELEHYWDGTADVLITNEQASNGITLQWQKRGQEVTINEVIAPATGIYTLTVAYINNGDVTKQKLEVNGQTYSVDLSQSEVLNKVSVVLPLQGGVNTVVLPFSQKQVELDYMELAYVDLAASDGQLLQGMALSRTSLLDELGLTANNTEYSYELPVESGRYTVAIAYKNANDKQIMKLETRKSSTMVNIFHNNVNEWKYASAEIDVEKNEQIKLYVNGSAEIAYIRLLTTLPEGEELSFRNRQTGNMLQPNNGSKKLEEGYRQYVETKTPAQGWSLEYAEDGSYYIRNSISGYYMTATSGGVVQLELQHLPSQRWNFLYSEEASYVLKNVETGVSPIAISADPNKYENLSFEQINSKDWQVWLVESFQ
ncbi:MAG: family 43 glycosylhydrolase [Candidatus Pristimantibacillus lignocellulolyticus]|uniref:Family 43 glycosylhydrolase n=1 Tax=Candidatus Pristimantibacillus lignocellulolyticus TaxID=2994561 RepID=A0A9J6Z989_9BACL|nr:MAG: family 43 glycosylhydrolase [Candidatus Pristimantibacillus lignocellulolyticus]